MTAPGAPRTTIVSVAWNSADVLPAMLASIPQGVPVPIDWQPIPHPQTATD